MFNVTDTISLLKPKPRTLEEIHVHQSYTFYPQIKSPFGRGEREGV